MTAKRDLKRRVRERQTRTGESYVTALRHVTAQGNPEPAVPVVELIDLTEVGAPLGFKCKIWMFPGLARRIDAAAALERLRAILVALERDPELDRMRDLALRGVCAAPGRLDLEELEDYRRFLERTRAGLGGVSPRGNMIAFHVDGRAGAELVIARTWARAYAPHLPARAPGFVLATPEPVTADPLGRWGVLP
jgi:hypothetical protein